MQRVLNSTCESFLLISMELAYRLEFHVHASLHRALMHKTEDKELLSESQ